MDEQLQTTEARAPGGKLRNYFGLILPIKSLVTGAFGFATVTALLVLDWHYALAWSLTGTVALGSLVFTLGSIVALRLHWRRVVVGFLAAWIVSLAVVFGVLFSGSLNDTHMPTMQAVGDSTFLQSALEKANKKGVAPVDWKALEGLGLVGSESSMFGRYYERDDVTWNLKYDAAGKFTGTLHFKGNPLHNIPDCNVHINERRRPVVKTGEFKRYLPVRPKDMK